MAIEKDINPTVLNEQNQVPLGQEDMSVAIEAIKDRGTEGFQMQEDGSAILEATMVEEIDTDFDSNLAEVLDPQDLRNISNELIAGIEKDKASREDWEKTYKDGLEYLGMRFDEERSEPFAGASGVIHPLLGEAVTTFQAQAYKELLPAGGPVKTQVIGAYDSLAEEQAQRVKEFMNYQITHVMEEFDEELDQMLFYLPLAGSAFKKVYYDEGLGRAVSKFVAPEDLIVPYYTTDLETCNRITNVIKISENEVRKLQSVGFYKKVDISSGDSADGSTTLDTKDSGSSYITKNDANGIIQTAEIDVARDDAHLPDENDVFRPIGTLIEPSTINYTTNSENASVWAGIGGQTTNVSNLSLIHI